MPQKTIQNMNEQRVCVRDMKWHKESDAPEEMSRGSAVRDMKWHKESDAPEEMSRSAVRDMK